MDKNLIFASLLSIGFLMLWFRLFPPQQPHPAQTSSVSTNSSVSGIRSLGVESQNEKELESGVEKTLEFGGGKIVIASHGAGLLHWWVKESEKVDLNGKNRADLVNHPSSLNFLSAENLPLNTFPESDFKEVQTKSIPGKGIQSQWETVLNSGIQVDKIFSVSEDYFLSLQLILKNTTEAPLTVPELRIGWNHGLGTVASEFKENPRVSRVLAYPSPTQEVEVFKTGEQLSQYQWVGVDNRYYLAVLFPERGQFDHIYTKHSKINPPEAIMASNTFLLGPGESREYLIKVYGGPKGYVHLRSLGLGLENAVNFGTFGFLGKWALKALFRLHGWIGNYGWSIVLLTAALQVLVFPLSLKSFRSSSAMKKLQPKIQELQKRYKQDPKRLNQEMLQLYKESGTNPFGGCIPMILQIPIFWAFFTMLRNSYELRGTPWIFWIHDLSQKDPYHVLPIVMGAGMFLQQKIMGTPGADPTQAKMMMFMPVMFTVMFLNFPSGLVLYWLTNSLLTTGMQFYFSRAHSSPVVPKLKIT